MKIQNHQKMIHNREEIMVADVRHSNMLYSSDKDTVTLSDAVEYRFKGLFELYFKLKLVQLEVPKYLDKDMLLWRSMAVRHAKGDYRHSNDEKRAVRRIAEWTVEVNCKLRNQEYVPVIWGD